MEAGKPRRTLGGHHGPSKEGFREDLDRDTKGLARPNPSCGDGRADDGKRVPTRLKLNRRPLGPWGEVQEGGPPGSLGGDSDSTVSGPLEGPFLDFFRFFFFNVFWVSQKYIFWSIFGASLAFWLKF